MTRMSCPKQRTTRWRRRLAACVTIASLWCTTANAEVYRFVDGPLTATWTAGHWPGEHELPGVYCLRFPHPERAKSYTTGFLNGGAISFIRVDYPDDIGAYVVTSTIPVGRTAAAEFQRLQDIERYMADASGGRFHVSLSGQGLGPVIELQMHDLIAETPAGPFPMMRVQRKRVEGQPVSRSAHRLFVRGPDRFEVAVLGAADASSAADGGVALAQKVTAFADEMLAALHDCTAKIPIRTGEPDDVR